MDVRSRPTIREHLQKEDVQERILQYIHKGRDEATVTISRAAELFSITENKLRDWEEYGFLNPLRPGGPKGRRLYTPAELDKLAIIRELIDAGYAASDIPPDIDKLWHTIRPLISSSSSNTGTPEKLDPTSTISPLTEMAIDTRITLGRRELFWRHFVSQALRLSLMLICEDIPHTSAGLLLPLNPTVKLSTVQNIEDLAFVGESLVGWLSQSRSSHTLLTYKPTFQYMSDFRIESLRITKSGIPHEESRADNTIIIVQREAKPLTLSASVVDTIRRLLRPIYAQVERTRSCFGPGLRDFMLPATDLENNANYEDIILNGLAEMVVEMGGWASSEQRRWRFASIFLPNYPASILSQQQRSLVVRAQSEHAPFIVGVTTHVPQEPFISECIKAFQSGHNVYQPDILIKDEDQAVGRPEGVIRSSIAIPIDGADGTSIAVLYVASDYKAAFTLEDQRVLRMLGRMIREVLDTYHTRVQSASRLRDVIVKPYIADTHFQEFLSENDFVHHVEDILTDVQQRSTFQPSETVSFIAVDIDNHSSIANKYGDRMARDLSRAVGLRIHSQLRAFKDEEEYKLYHICADRFYILLHNMSLEQARTKAELLKQTLEGSYSIDPHRSPMGQSTPSENMVVISNTTVRLGVSSYPYSKLKEILQRYATESMVVEVRMQITGFLEEELALGKQKGGNIVMSWDPHTQGFVRITR